MNLDNGGRYFLCRRCSGLAHASQSEPAWDRALRRASKIRLKLGGAPGLDAPLPRRPKGMHRKTYDRMTDELLALEEAGYERLAYLLDRCERRTGGGRRSWRP